MKNFRTAAGGLTGIVCAGILQGCGGYHGSAAMTPTSISINPTPTSTQIYLSYAPQVTQPNLTNAIGAGLGFVNVYDTSGQLIKQLIAGADGIYGRIDLSAP